MGASKYLYSIFSLIRNKLQQQYMRRQQVQIKGNIISGKLWQKQPQPILEIQMKLNQKEESLIFSALTRNKFKTKEYVCQVKPAEFQAQCQKNGARSLIDTCSQLFLLVKANHQQFKKTFDQIFHFNPQNEIEISAQLLINNLGKQGKRKLIKFVFPTKEVNETHFLGIERLQSKIKQLEEQVTTLQNQLSDKKQLQRTLWSQFQSAPSQIMIKQNMVINLKREIQFLLYKQSVYQDNELKIQFKTRSKGVIQFKVFTYRNIDNFQHQCNIEESDHTSTWIESQIGDIITATVNSQGYQILLERNQKEEVSIQGESQLKPTYGYTRLRKVVQFKKLMSWHQSHFGIGLPFSTQILILRVQNEYHPEHHQ